MADEQLKTPLSVHFPLLGRTESDNIKEWEIDSSYLVSTDAFSFTLFNEDLSKLRNLELQPVELSINGASQLLGRIDITEIGDDGSSIKCMGRDYLADIVECNIDPSAKFPEGATLAEALLDVVKPCGIDTIFDSADVSLASIRTGVNVSKGKGKRGKLKITDDYKPRDGEGIYEFCNRVVARHGATIQPGPQRNTLVIDRPNYLAPVLYEINRSNDVIGSGKNNVIRASARRDYSKFPTFVFFTGTQGKSGTSGSGNSVFFNMLDIPYNSEMAGILKAALAPNRFKPGELQDNPGILYRLLFHRDKDARGQEQTTRAALRAISDRTKDSLSYSCTVRGHVDTRSGAIWSSNVMAMVNDTIAGIHEPLWIASRKLRYSGSSVETDLELWRPEAFNLGEDPND